MRNWVRNSARVALVAAGIATVSSGTVVAANADTTRGDLSVLGGNQLNAPVSVPINISGNSAALLGSAKAESPGGAYVDHRDEDGDSMLTSGMLSFGGGNQLHAPVDAPVNICGNALAIGGVAKAACKGTAIVTDRGMSSIQKTSGILSVLGGNQAYTPVSSPINICGNAAAALGAAKAYCVGGAYVDHDGHGKKNHGHDKPFKPCDHGLSSVGRYKHGCEVAAPIAKPVAPPKKKPRKAPKVRDVRTPKILPSTRRTALAPVPPTVPGQATGSEPLVDGTTQHPAAQKLQDLIRAIGLPIPSPDHAAEYRPTLGVTKGMPVRVASIPILR
ncbi:chaplin family protein [Actinomadura fulvescens]|uniref:Chaplin domain-containing protein n=1 Tax=Actinomadura fulvescens TaxID=46160 RepID=A0ABP6D169_9ACTN